MKEHSEQLDEQVPVVIVTNLPGDPGGFIQTMCAYKKEVHIIMSNGDRFTGKIESYTGEVIQFKMNRPKGWTWFTPHTAVAVIYRAHVAMIIQDSGE